MKNIIILTLTLLLFVGFVSAQEMSIVEEEDIIIAGIVPGDFLYNTELALERFTELFGERFKIAHAQERLAEAKLMIAEGKINESQIAIKGFDNIYSRIRNRERLMEHKEFRDNLGMKISAIASRGNMTEADIQQIKMLVFQHRDKIRQENIEIISKDKNIELSEASILLEVEQQKIQNRVTERVSNRFMMLNN